MIKGIWTTDINEANYNFKIYEKDFLEFRNEIITWIYHPIKNPSLEEKFIDRINKLEPTHKNYVDEVKKKINTQPVIKKKILIKRKI
jgi:hypothetical protein